ncbi:Uncharacterised protein [Metakosakonia massiliensis]|uniref:Uncharacterized protein n=1 Tax=Phytobacter massiliensis TaxID=1485952 RepID=A0A6N3CAZ5_9ENTR
MTKSKAFAVMNLYTVSQTRLPCGSHILYSLRNVEN